MERKTPAPALLTRTSIPSCSPAADVIVICNACASALSQRSARILCAPRRSEEHTSELQSLMRISYAVFCLKKQHTPTHSTQHSLHTMFTYAYSQDHLTYKH